MTVSASLVRPLGSLGISVALFAGCSTSLTLNNDTLQQAIAQGLATQAQVQATVTCPNDRPLKAGDTFKCTALTSDGSTLEITVVQTDDQGHVNWNVTGAS